MIFVVRYPGRNTALAHGRCAYFLAVSEFRRESKRAAPFIQEGRSCGYRYETETVHLRQLDRFLCDIGLKSLGLPKSAVESWTEKRPNDRPRTHQARISIVLATPV